MHHYLHMALGLAVATLVVHPACGAVRDAAANGFSVVESVHIAAAPDTVYAELVQPAHWWSSQHTFSQSAANLTLEVKAGGCWCETLPDGSVQHLIVVMARTGKKLVMRGALGPLQGLGVDGAMTIDLKPADGGTDLTATYNVGGYLKDGLASWAPPVDNVLGEQFNRLKTDVETGGKQAKP
jgi:uncharacterized protein YndB with AHSA1/START domain